MKLKHIIFGDSLRLHVGEKCYLQNTLFNLSSGEIYIGDYTFFGHNCCVVTGTHDITLRKRERQKSYPKEGRDIYIGDGVWVASGVTIIGPCKIGDDAVIAAGSVLLPGTYKGGCVYAGTPAKLIKEIVFKN